MKRIFQIAICLGSIFATVGVSFAEDFEQSLRQLKKPIAVVSTDMYLDGGTISVVLKDAANHSLKFCLDGRLMSASYGNFFLGVEHASYRGVQVRSDSGIEHYLIEILKEWIIKDSAGHEENKLMIDQILDRVKARRVAEQRTAN